MAGEKKQTKKEREFLKWQQRVIEREREMTNEELLQEVIGLAGGDDYDGCFTKRGAWEFDYLQGKLYERLQGWLEEDKAPPAPQSDGRDRPDGAGERKERWRRAMPPQPRGVVQRQDTKLWISL